jgi:hypothetical protein
MQSLQIFQFAKFSRDGTWGIQNTKTQSKHMTNKSPYPTQYWTQVKGRRGKRVPVSLLKLNCRTVKLANWPNWIGMGPGVYKIQSKHTTNESHYPTGAIGHTQGKSLPQYWTQVRGEEAREYRQACYWINSNPANLLIVPIEPEWDLGGIHNLVKTYNNQVTLSDWYDRAYARQVSIFVYGTRQGKKRGWSTGKLVIV